MTLFEKAKKRYNDIMETIGYEHNTIGTRLSENTENWNLRDMVAECDYVLSTYYEDGHANYDLKYYSYKDWRSETGKLKRFIDAYKYDAMKMKCYTRHCSNFD